MIQRANAAIKDNGRQAKKNPKTSKEMVGISVTQRGVRDTVRQLKMAMSALQTAAKNACWKLCNKSAAKLAKKSKELHVEIKDLEVVL